MSLSHTQDGVTPLIRSRGVTSYVTESEELESETIMDFDFEDYEKQLNDRAFQLFALKYFALIEEKEIESDKERAAILTARCSALLTAWFDMYYNAYCESPIELLLAAAMFFVNNGYNCLDVYPWDFVEAMHDRNPDNAAKDLQTVCFPQAPIGKMRVDFLVVSRAGDQTRKFVVECDGHDYHEKTKEQASRDKKRDRELTKFGIPVLRFTGSDIFKKPNACAQEIADFAYRQIETMLFYQGKSPILPIEGALA